MLLPLLLGMTAIAAPPPRLVLSAGAVDRSAEDGRIDGLRASAGFSFGDLELGGEADIGLDPFAIRSSDEIIIQTIGDHGVFWPVSNDRWGAMLVGRWSLGAAGRPKLSGGPNLVVAPGLHRIQRTWLSTITTATSQTLLYTPTERSWEPGLVTGGEIEVWANSRFGARLRLAHDLRWSPEPDYTSAMSGGRTLTSNWSTNLDLCWMGVSR